MIQKAVHIIFALALLLAFAPPALAAKHSAELFLQVGYAAGINSVSFSQNIARQAACFKKSLTFPVYPV